MIGSALKKLAAENGMTVESGAAYGMLQGCFVTLTEGAGYKRMSIYVGSQAAATKTDAEGAAPVALPAKTIADMIAEASGEDNIYRLMTKHPNISALVVNHGGSVVTVNFFDNPGTMACINRFVTEMLPQIAPLCQPRQCLCCGEDAIGDGYPVMIAADTVVPMHGHCMDGVVAHDAQKKQGGLDLGFLGAFAGAMWGALVWGFVYYNGYMASIVGLLIGFLASFGYDLLKGKPGIRKIVSIVICTILAVAAGMLGAFAWGGHVEYQSLSSALKSVMDEFSFIKLGFSAMFEDSTFVTEMLKDMGLGLLFAGLGLVDVLRKNLTGSADAGKPKQLNGTM